MKTGAATRSSTVTEYRWLTGPTVCRGPLRPANGSAEIFETGAVRRLQCDVFAAVLVVRSRWHLQRCRPGQPEAATRDFTDDVDHGGQSCTSGSGPAAPPGVRHAATLPLTNYTQDSGDFNGDGQTSFFEAARNRFFNPPYVGAGNGTGRATSTSARSVRRRGSGPTEGVGGIWHVTGPGVITKLFADAGPEDPLFEGVQLHGLFELAHAVDFAECDYKSLPTHWSNVTKIYRSPE